MRLPDGNGIELVSEIAQHYPRTPVAMITASAAWTWPWKKAGAFDFVSKPVDIAVLRGLVKHALELNNTDRPHPAPVPNRRAPARRLAGDGRCAPPSARSRAARRRSHPRRIGSRELVARTIHAQGARAAARSCRSTAAPFPAN
jgi:two-component system response regulator PilR (NtrC family)